MKLYIRQKVFSALDHFFVKDENGNDKYEVRSPGGITVGLKLHIHTMDGKEVAYINQKAMSLNPTFRVFVNGVQTATIVKKFTLLKPRYEVKELNWTIKGDFSAHEYTISDGSGVVMAIRKEWLTLGDTFVLEFNNTAHELEALAVVFAIDRIVDQEENGIEINLN